MNKEQSQDVAAVQVTLDMLMKRYQAAKGIADLWQNILEACFHYAVPFRNRFYQPTDQFQGDTKNTRVFDTTAVEATKTFVSKLQDTMTPPQVQWGFLEVDDSMVDDPDQDASILEEAQMALDKYMRRLFSFIHASNFDVVINECYYDLAIGTSCIVVNQNTDAEPLMFTSMPIDKLAIQEAANGRIESWYRTWQNLKVCELKLRWKKIELLPNMIVDLMGDPDVRVKQLYEGVSFFPNNGNKPYLYAVWSAEGILMTEWLESNPGIVWRFQKTNNETWGRGPVMDALPTIITLNEMARIEIAAANLNVFKPYMGFSDAVFNPHTFTLEPFSIIPIAPIGTGGQVPLIPLPSSADAQFGQMLITDLRLQVKSLLFAESPSDQPGIQPQTAYELSLRQQTLAQKIGPLFSRLQQEFLWPLIQRCAHILHSMGILPRPDLKGVPIIFKYKSPLALAKGQQDVSRVTQWTQVMQGIMGPEATQVYINPKTTPYLLAQSLQVDPRYLNDPDAVAEVMQQVQNQHNDQILANSQAMTPEAPQNPNEQMIQPSGA
jgi:hypothetical protein